MANPEHFAILKEALEKNDISIWNKWFDNNPEVQPTLTGADLRGANLSKINLYGAQMQEIKLYGANLNDATLDHTNLAGVDLYGVSLYRANLRHANLSVKVET